MKKILFFIGSRANYSSIKSVMEEVNKRKNLKLQIILGASGLIDKYGDLSKSIQNDGFKINKKIYFLVEGENLITMAKSTGLGLIGIADALAELKPDIVFTVGDRFETMATTLAASYMNIPLAHTMGGEVSGTIDESIRHAITKFAHIHFPASKDAAVRIFKLGERKETIFNYGCPRIDLVKNELKKNRISSLNKSLFKEGVGYKLDLNKKFLIISQHPVTTEFGSSEKQIINTLKAANMSGLQSIVIWPNSDAGSQDIAKGIRKWREKVDTKKMHFFKMLKIEDYIQLLNHTSCLIGNSSSGIRECAYIGTPVVNIGTRQNGRDKSQNVINCDNSIEMISRSIKIQLDRNKKYTSNSIYGKGDAAKKIVNKITHLKNINIQKMIRY